MAFFHGELHFKIAKSSISEAQGLKCLLLLLRTSPKSASLDPEGDVNGRQEQKRTEKLEHKKDGWGRDS